MNGGRKSVGIVDPVHDVEITILVEAARFDKAKFPLALAFGTTIKLPEPFLYGFVVTELITLSLSGSLGSKPNPLPFSSFLFLCSL